MCNNDELGDPVPGYYKSCWCKVGPWTIRSNGFEGWGEVMANQYEYNNGDKYIKAYGFSGSGWFRHCDRYTNWNFG